MTGLDGVKFIADDKVVFGEGNTQEQAEANPDKWLLELLKKARAKNQRCNNKKLRFRMKQVPYIGHLPTGSGLQVDPSTVSAITNMATPDCVGAVRLFTGLTNHMAKFHSGSVRYT